ncbi:hypothetical protein EMIT0111MI5_190105 [Burkholderia sp. IT-111MI5]
MAAVPPGLDSVRARERGTRRVAARARLSVADACGTGVPFEWRGGGATFAMIARLLISAAIHSRSPVVVRQLIG